MWRIKSKTDFTVGFKDEPAILVCLDGRGTMKYSDNEYSIAKGEVMLLPAIIGQLELTPDKELSLLQIAMPGTKSD